MIQARSARQNVVGDVQNMIAFVVRQVDLEHVYVLVEGLNQPTLAGEELDDANAAAPDPARTARDIEMNIAGGEHGVVAWRAIAIAKSSGDAPLAAKQFLGCSIAHSKRLLAYEVEGIGTRFI